MGSRSCWAALLFVATCTLGAWGVGPLSYLTTVGDFDIVGTVAEVDTNPAEIYDSTTDVFRPGGGDTVPQRLLFSADGILVRQAGLELDSGGQEIETWAYEWEYDAQTVLRSVIHYVLGKVLVRVTYSVSNNSGVLCLTPKVDPGPAGNVAQNEPRYQLSGWQSSVSREVGVFLGRAAEPSWIVKLEGVRKKSVVQPIRSGSGAEGEIRSDFDDSGRLVSDTYPWGTISYSRQSPERTSFRLSVSGQPDDMRIFENLLDERGNWIERTLYRVSENTRIPLSRETRKIRYR